MLKPLRDRIVIRPQERQKSHTLIVIDSEEKPNIGVVVATGPGKADERGRIQPLDVKIGQTVRFGEFMFPEYFENGQKYLVMQEADIAGIVE